MSNLDNFKLIIMRDLLDNCHNSDSILAFLAPLDIPQNQKDLLIKKYAHKEMNKNIADELNITPRYFQILLNDSLISSYNAFKANIRKASTLHK